MRTQQHLLFCGHWFCCHTSTQGSQKSPQLSGQQKASLDSPWGTQCSVSRRRFVWSLPRPPCRATPATIDLGHHHSRAFRAAAAAAAGAVTGAAVDVDQIFESPGLSLDAVPRLCPRRRHPSRRGCRWQRGLISAFDSRPSLLPLHLII